MNYVSTDAANYFCEMLACRLPTSEMESGS